MKNASKEKLGSTQLPQNRLNKTQVPPNPPEKFENTYYGQSKNAIEQSKQVPSSLPPRAGSSQKINYKVSDNMTNSKIMEAKKGLQLLKKKMSRNGMSREKNTSVEKKEEYNEQPVSKKTIYRPQNEEEQDYYQDNKKPSQKAIDKQPSREEMKKTQTTKIMDKSPPIPTKASMEDRPIKRQPKQEYINDAEEVPITANQDFMAILEREMAKQQSKGGAKEVKPSKKAMTYNEEPQQLELVVCSKGCERKFNTEAIQKHEKICEKVFQSKRKAFNAAQKRKIDQQGFKQPAQTPPPPTRTEKSKKTTAPVKEEKVPKWKLQSAAFRAGLKQGRGQTLSAEQKNFTEQASCMVQCSFCGRKFNEDAAKRHIPICETKSKQLPKMSTKKR